MRVRWAVVGAALGWLLLAPVAQAQGWDIYDWAAARHGISAARLRCLAGRESGHADYAYNRAGPYMGRLQFDWPTWRYGSHLAGWDGYSPYDAEAAVDTAAYLIALGQGWRWPPLRYC